MGKYTKRKEIFDLICNASSLGNLGLFVGAGFTKAVMEDSDLYQAYSWYELLEKCCDIMKVDERVLKQKGSYSEIASKICKQYAINENMNYENGVELLKNIIADLTNLYPTDESMKKYQECFKKLDVNWIVTTNYDTLLESIFIGKCLPLGPDECYFKINELIPVYHIHGIRTKPENIIITNEDYVSLFRPNDYRQSRLPFLIKESIVVMIGYGLGDINVITALDWSKNVYTNVSESYDTEIIQLLYKDNPKDKPYRDESGVLILEIDDISIFFKELNEFYDHYTKEHANKIEKINDCIQMFLSPDAKQIKEFIDDSEIRKNIIGFIAELNMEFSYIYPSYINFLKLVSADLEKRAEPRGAFYAYNEKLMLLIDIFEKVDLKKIPPIFFSFLADSLDRVACYVGKGWGEAWDAQDTWNNDKIRISKIVKDELKRYADSKKGCYALKKLLQS